MSCAGSGAAAPLPDPDQGPHIVNTGLPRADEGAWLLGRSRWSWRAGIASASHSLQDDAGGETLLFDGETTRLSLRAEHGVSDRLQLGVEIPYLLHESGNLDRVVERWHDWFGLPDGLRNLVAEDQLDFRYRDNGDWPLDIQSNQRGIGDIRLLAGWQLSRSEQRATALRMVIKLPTGDSERLTGSGATDIALTLAGDYRALFGNPRWSGFYRLSATAIGQPDRIASRARDLVGQVAGGLSFTVNDRLEFAAQANLRSAAYDSELRPLGATSVLLTTGGTLRLGRHYSLAIAVGEDIAVDTAPDVTLILSLRYSPEQSR